MTRKSAVALMAFRDSLPILMGYGVMGFAAGVVFAACSEMSNPAFWSAFIAATSFSGTLQFAIGNWFKDGWSAALVALTTFAISFRYAFYGISLIGRWRGIGFFRKFFLIVGLTDENYALESSRHFARQTDFERYCLLLTMFNLSYWVTGCTLGALLGDVLKIPDKGVDFVMAALFITILTDQVRQLFGRKGAVQ
ncbi:MAG: AzlC family ABC transporter permease [Kiritimatiellae bacterium]|nr:AzlC family ABC transporter permease [Kiritimatiellia bacterium]